MSKNAENKIDKVESNNENQRNVTYDWIRLIATILVVVAHCRYLSIHTTYGGVDYILPEYTNPFYYSFFMRLLRGMAGWVPSFLMPLFFMLSGAVLALKPIKKFEEVVKSKTKRLLIPYFIYGWLFMLPVKLLGNFYNKETFLLAMKGFLSGTDSGHLWFLTSLFWIIIIFTLLEKATKRIKANNPYLLLMIAGIIQLTHKYIPIDILGLKQGMEYIFWFALGYCFEYERKRNTPWNTTKTMIAFAILLIIEIINKKYNILNSFFSILCGSFMIYLLSDLCTRLFKNFVKTKVWKILTRNLFYIYLFHDPLEYIVLRIFMNNTYLNSALGCILYATSRTLGIIVISIILGELIRCIKNLVSGHRKSSNPLNKMQDKEKGIKEF